MLLLEAVFTILFCACVKRSTDAVIADLLPWPREKHVFKWEPLCSHLSLTEGIRADLSLTAEELEAAAEFRRAKLAAYNARVAADKPRISALNAANRQKGLAANSSLSFCIIVTAVMGELNFFVDHSLQHAQIMAGNLSPKSDAESPSFKSCRRSCSFS